MVNPYRLETGFVRRCAEDLCGEIGFSPTAETELIATKLTWVDAFQALRGGRVVWSDKEEADSARSIVVGSTCDGEQIRLTIVWCFAPPQVLVVSVERI